MSSCGGEVRYRCQVFALNNYRLRTVNPIANKFKAIEGCKTLKAPQIMVFGFVVYIYN